mgnify:CR=1 FL=1
MENRKGSASTVDMTVEVFKAMSKASGENIRFMYSMAFAGGLLPKQKPEQHRAAERARTKKMMKGKTIVDKEKLQELLKLVRAFEDPLGEAERATERGKYMAYQLNMEFEEESSDRSKLYFWDENKLRSDIAAEYAYKALVSVAEMSKQYNTIIELLNNIAISEHGNTHEQTE